MFDLTRARDLAAILKDVVTSLALLCGSLWAIMRFGWFREYRQAQQAVSIAFQTYFVLSNGNTFLYVNVQVENLGASEIRAVSAELSVLLLMSGAEVDAP